MRLMVSDKSPSAPIFDSGDIDVNGHWHGSEMGCLECRTTMPMVIDWKVYPDRPCGSMLVCGDCWAEFADWEAA